MFVSISAMNILVKVTASFVLSSSMNLKIILSVKLEVFSLTFRPHLFLSQCGWMGGLHVYALATVLIPTFVECFYTSLLHVHSITKIVSSET